MIKPQFCKSVDYQDGCEKSPGCCRCPYNSINLLEDLDQWLSPREFKAFHSRFLLTPPGPEIVEQWVKQLCHDREMLEIARIALIGIPEKIDMYEALNKTSNYYRYVGRKDEQ